MDESTNERVRRFRPAETGAAGSRKRFVRRAAAATTGAAAAGVAGVVVASGTFMADPAGAAQAAETACKAGQTCKKV